LDLFLLHKTQNNSIYIYDIYILLFCVLCNITPIRNNKNNLVLIFNKKQVKNFLVKLITTIFVILLIWLTFWLEFRLQNNVDFLYQIGSISSIIK
jgi:hypothetical protein